MIATAFVKNSTKELLAFLKCGNTMPTLTFKVTLDEARRIMAEARGKKMTLSEYIQGRALSDGKSSGHVRHFRCAHTGAKIFSSSPGARPLTTETVREMQADFP
jgi:hypothetical protein